MFSDNNKILVKDKSGQFKTVSLSDDPVKSSAKAEFHRASKKQTIPQKHVIKQDDAVQVEPVQQIKPVTEEKKQVEQPVEPVVEKQEHVKKESKVPSFYFNVSDEEEVAQFKNKDNEDVRQKKEDMLKLEAQRFMQMIPKDLLPEQQKKFEKILISYLRGVRTELEVGEILVRDSMKGGFGFEREEVRKFIKNLKNKKIFFEGLTLEKIKELKKVDNVKKQEPKVEAKEIVKEEIKEREPVVEQKVEKQEEAVQDILAKMDKNEAPKVQEIVSPQLKQPKHVKIDRPVQPIQKPSFNVQQKKTQGPVEELLNLTLEEFRNFGSNPKERVNKIYEKINLLEEESIDKKTQGISSWKNSAVYKEYVKAGEESLSKGVSIEEAVDKNGKISIDEFNAIADLNEQLNY